MFIHRQKQKGMVLICAVAILAVLSIMATSFVRMMTLNLQAAKNHLNYVDAKFAAIAGIEDAKAKMWQYMHTGSESDKLNPSQEFDNEAYKGYVGRTVTKDGTTSKIGRYEYNGNRYEFKIQDNQGKLNLNSHHPYEYDITIDTTGKITYTKVKDIKDEPVNKPKELEKRQLASNSIMNNIIYHLAKQCNFTDNESSNIADALRPKDLNRHIIYSLAEVENAIKSYGDSTKRQSFLDNVCVISAIDSKCYTIEDPKRANYEYEEKDSDDIKTEVQKYINKYNTKYYREYRSPVNINTASKKLIAALINAIEAGVYIYTPTSAKMQNLNNETQQDLIDNTESEYEYKITPQSITFTVNENSDIVKNLFDQKFSSMESIEKNIRDTYPTNKLIYDTLICNFNPNVRDNFYNVDYTYALSVQKSNLLSYSTEFCIESYGQLKITSLGKVTAGVINSTPRVVSSALMEEIIAFGSLASSTTYGDFIYNKNTTTIVADKNTFPYYAQEAELLLNRQSTLGYIQPNFMTKPISSVSTYCRKVYDGLLMKEMLLNNTQSIKTKSIRPYRDINNTAYNNFSNFDIPTKPFETVDIFSSSGTISLWFKLTDDIKSIPSKQEDNTNSFCSLFSISHLGPENEFVEFPVSYYKEGANAGESIKAKYHDGIQMYAYKNTKNQIRISRLFFCSYWPSESTETPTGINSLAVDVDNKYLPGQKKNNSKQERKSVRSDCYITLTEGKLEANDWNCLTITWDDTKQDNGALSATLWNTKNGTISNSICLTRRPLNDINQPKFCLLNEIASNSNSLTRFQLNGMDRHQYSVQQGNTKGDGRLFQIDTKLHLPGNTTINKIESSDTSQAYKITNLSDYKVYIQLRSKLRDNELEKEDLSNIDPNKNPLINHELKKVSMWGDIGTINCISYDTSRKDAQTYASVEKVNAPARISNQNDTDLECKINLKHITSDNNLHPTVLDSITLQILYPYVYSSSNL